MKSARAAKDLSQADLAELCNVSRQTINAIEKGRYVVVRAVCFPDLLLCQIHYITDYSFFFLKEALEQIHQLNFTTLFKST